MSSPQQNHPDQSALTDFGLGRLDPPESSWIEEHLSECEACCDTLLNLKGDTFAGVVRTLPKPEKPEAEKEPTDSDSETPALPATRIGVTDGAMDDGDSVHSATMLVQSGDAFESSELPKELQNHPRYQIVEQIGQGGMGAVYRAQHRLMNRPVALKLINSQLIRHPQAVERFRREVQAAAQLAHPNIVAAYDAEQAGDVHFLAMEFVEGTDLSAVVQHRGPLPVTEACEYVRQTALGLEHAYEKGMIHRDIKPHNLMLSPDGQVRILDFGLAGFATEEAYRESEEASPGSDADTAPLHLTTIGSVMGTPDYIAPEQARDAHSADIRADIYSLGCTLHFLLAGKPVFEAKSVVDKLKAHATADLPKLVDSRDAPPELQDILDRMLAKDPADRFQTPAEVAEALAAFLEPQTDPAVVPEKPPTRRKMVRALLGGFITLLAGVIIVATTQGNFEVRSEVDGVQVTVSKDGKEFCVLDVNSGTSVFWLPTEEFQVTAKGDTVVTVSQKQVQVSWMGKQTVQITRAPRSKLPSEGTSQDSDTSDVPSLELANTLVGHTDSVASIDVTSDGRWAVSSSQDWTMRLWNLQTGECQHIFGSKVYGYADISPDDRFVAVGSTGPSFRIWDLETRGVHRTLKDGNGGVRGLTFSPDSRFILAVNDDGSVRYWDMEKEKIVHSFTLDSGFKHYAGTQISSDGRFGVVRPNAAAGNSKIYIFDLHAGTLLKKVKIVGGGQIAGHIALSGDSRTLLAPTGLHQTATAYDLDRRTERQISTNGVVVSFLPNNRYAVWGEKNGAVSVRDVQTGKLIAQSSNHKYPVQGMSVTPDGRVVLAGHARYSHMPVPNKETRENDFAIRVWRLPERMLPRSEIAVTAEPLKPKPTWRPEYGTGPIKADVNLINDPSFESTGTGEYYPDTWGHGNLIPDNAWRMQVVDGGRTGDRSWMIEGTGNIATVPSNRAPIDRSFRYGGSAWVKVKTGTAKLGLLYFDRFAGT